MSKAIKTYVITLEIEPMQVGASFTALPMHCTIMPRFLSVLEPAELTDALMSVLSHQSALRLIPSGHSAFGPKQQLATTLKPAPDILKLHNELYETLTNLGVTYTELDWVASGYKPHVTDKHGARLDPTSDFISRAAYLVAIEHPLQGRTRSVRYKFDFA